MKYRALKLLCLNLGIALLNVIMFSKGLVGLTFDGGANRRIILKHWQKKEARVFSMRTSIQLLNRLTA